MSYYLGPTHERWSPESWDDVVRAAANGALDETIWVELKEMLPPGKPGSGEIAKDLASLAVEGGLLLVGIKDDRGKAGEVVGVQLAHLSDRIDQISRDRIHPPLVVRTREIENPDAHGVGCLLVTVDASATAPHMVDERYWGRGSTGKRVLTDTDVRQILDRNAGRHNDVTAELREYIPTSIAPNRHALHLMFRPSSGRPEALDDLLYRRTHEVSLLIQESAQLVSPGYAIGDFPEHRRMARSVQFINFSSQFDPAQFDASQQEWAATITVRDDCRIIYTGSFLANRSWEGGVPHPRIRTGALAATTFQMTRLAALLGNEAGYGGNWDAAALLTHVRGVPPHVVDEGWPSPRTLSLFPEDEYGRVTAASSTELNDAPESVAERLIGPFLRVWALERRVFNRVILARSGG